ncbi:protein S40-7-like [Miscanthus floridulus]|uniref:protein S40-7-like n=1 Tax=Miscanthus floridulus TaxID=154761 RepID=UPI00345ADC34
MDRLLLSSRRPLPVPTHAATGADGDLLELDVLWPATPSEVGLGLLAVLPEDEGKKKKRAAAGGGGGVGFGGPTRSAAAAAAMARSAPVRIPSEPARRGRWAHAGGSAEDSGEAVVPPHEIVARRAAAHSSVLEGAGRTLKGRDLRRVRNAVLRRTGFLD